MIPVVKQAFVALMLRPVGWFGCQFDVLAFVWSDLVAGVL
jgi:hypothetical protein